ncbi:MAG: hypothetical protein K0R49_233 [Burkholderiales bacterium]|jgi:hypothetical protein|nr:hypothetical protein [Burkholderiales bacterium]
MKRQSKPRNYVALALLKRNGAGAHEKTTKAKRAQSKRQLIKELKNPSKTDGFFITSLIKYLYLVKNFILYYTLPIVYDFIYKTRFI